LDKDIPAEFLTKPGAFLDYLTRTRGDVYPEVAYLAAVIPETVYLLRRASGYVHSYEDLTTPDQILSVQMRELIATPQLCAKNDGRFAANHVRRLYRLGVTDEVIIEAAEAIAPVVGWSTILQVARAIETANDPSYTQGKLPEGGRPAELKHFPELDLGRDQKGHDPLQPEQVSLLATPEWAYVAGIDPGLAERAAAFVDHCLAANGRNRKRLLGAGPRELIAIAALCARGEADIAAQHIRRAYRYGITRRQVVEAISAVLPMTGAVTVQIGARAMWQAEAAGKGGGREPA
jgi:alkylhydroperoxidase/carboxymuconolactone decarboxylase family protein YurZ